MLVHHSTIRALGRCFQYRCVQYEHWESFVSIGKALTVLGRLCQYSRVLQERWKICVGTVENYRKTGEAMPL